MAFKVNELLKGFLQEMNIDLETSSWSLAVCPTAKSSWPRDFPDTCRLWDSTTTKSWIRTVSDGSGRVEDAYNEVMPGFWATLNENSGGLNKWALFWCGLQADCVLDHFFGVDYHSHLGTRRGGMSSTISRGAFSARSTALRIRFTDQVREGSREIFGLQRHRLHQRHGSPAAAGAVTSWALRHPTVGIINNAEALVEQYFSAMAISSWP
jgi:hypothetical protein